MYDIFILTFQYPHLTLCPMIELNSDGKVNRVFHSTKSGGYAPPLDPLALQDFYDAKDKLIALFEDESNVIYHRLRAGELVFFGNTRVLHSRTSFDPSKAARHLQVFIYFLILKGNVCRP